MAVVRHAQVAPAGAVPVAEQHRQRAVPGLERDRWPVPGPAARAGTARSWRSCWSARPRDRARGSCRRRASAGLIRLPGRRECGRPRGGRQLEPPRLVGPLEPAASEAAQHERLADPKDREIRVPVRVHVERVGAGDARDVGHRVASRRERQLATDVAAVAEQLRGVGAAGHVQVRAAVLVAVQDGHAAAGRERRAAVVRVGEAGGRRLLHEPRSAKGVRGGRHPAEDQRRPATATTATTPTIPAATATRRPRPVTTRPSHRSSAGRRSRRRSRPRIRSHGP